MKAPRFGSKRRLPVLWLASGALSAALIAWVLVDLGGGGRSRDAPASGGESTRSGAVVGDTVPGGPPAVNEYLRFASRHDGAADANHDHDYTADGLRRLAAALSALLQFDPGTAASQRMQIVSLYERADDLQRDPTSPKHAEFARDAFTTAAELTRWIQERDAPAAADAVKELRDAAIGLDPDVPLLEQASALERYFGLASAVVRTLATQRDTDGGRTT